MIIIDDFIKDEILLNDIKNKKDFFGKNGNFMWWNGWWNNQANTLKKRLIEYIWRYNSPDKSYDISGFEYWTGVYGDGHPNTDLGWHFDKDELHWKRTGGQENDGEIITPEIGTVFYPMDTEFEGGYLEIEKSNGEVERIEPKFNRLIIFNAGGDKHRVTKVKNGVRYAIAINLWQAVPVAAQEETMTTEKPEFSIPLSIKSNGLKGGLS